jgi:hypothetical protein
MPTTIDEGNSFMLIRSAICALLLPASSLAFADAPIPQSNSEIFVGAGGQRLQYTEDVDNQFADSEIGKQAAATAGATWQGSVFGWRNVYAQGQYSFARGKTAYDGFLQSTQSPVLIPWTSSTDDETADWQLRLGKGFAFYGDEQMLTPFFAVGHHRWVRNSAQTDYPYGYLETYKHNSAELGLLAQVAFTQRLVGTVEIEAGESFGAGVAAPALGTDSALGAQRILGCGIALDYAFTRHLHAQLEYHDVSFRYRMSSVVNGYFEPDSATFQSTAFLKIALSL